MISICKMDLYRMFKTKSLYIVWGVMAFIIVLISYVLSEGGTLFDSSHPITESLHENILIVSIFISIFTVIFSTSDANCGYIKNIAGQLPKRSVLIFSKAFSLLVYSILTMSLYIIITALSDLIFEGHVNWGDMSLTIKYILIETILLYAVAILCMGYSILIRKTSIATTLSVATSSGALSGGIVYPIINEIAENMGAKNFDVYNYSLLGNIDKLIYDMFSSEELLNNPAYVFTNSDFFIPVIVAISFVAVSITISCIVFKKRDIV